MGHRRRSRPRHRRRLYAVFSTKASTSGELAPSQLYTVAPIDLEVKITKDGEIHAVENIDITCKLEGTSTITSLVKEGTSVKKGDELLTLDSTEIRQKIEDTDLSLKKTEAEVSNSSEMYEIQKSVNDTNLESAQVALDLANLDLKQYEDGSYPQQLASSQTEVEMARITLNNRLDDLASTKRLFLKQFVTRDGCEEGRSGCPDRPERARQGRNRPQGARRIHAPDGSDQPKEHARPMRTARQPHQARKPQ